MATVVPLRPVVAGKIQYEAKVGRFPLSARRWWSTVCMKVVPLGDRVVVRPLPAEEKSPGGILLPDLARERPQQGRVLSVGDGRLLANGQRANPQVLEGDRVVFARYAGTEVLVDREALLILSEDEILAVLG